MSVCENLSNETVWRLQQDGEIIYNLHSGQSDVIQSQARVTAAIAGTGGGKTTIGPLWCMLQLKRCIDEGKKDIKGLIVAPTYSILSRATAPTLVDMFKQTDVAGTFVESKNRYYLPNNLGILWFCSADNSQSIEGGQYDFCWIDEGGQISYSAWIAIQGRTGQKQAPILITTTPYTENWLRYEVFDRFLQGDKDYNVITWRSIDNPAYPVEEYNRMKETLPWHIFDMRYNGNFTKPEGLIYPEFNTCIVDDYDPPAGRLVGGIDFGFSDPFVALAGVLYIEEATGRDILYIFYERYISKLGISEHSEFLPNIDIYYADPSRPDSIRDLTLAGHKCRPAKTNKIDLGISEVNKRIKSKRLHISRDCKCLITEAKNYSYPQQTPEQPNVGEKPQVKQLDHAMDALRYLCVSL